MPAAPGRQPAPRHAGILLALILGTQLMVVLDVNIITIALPRIQQALEFSPASLSWVQNAYGLAFGGLLLLGARAGDLLGQRRTFIAGVSVFTLASLLAGLARTAEALLAARALQGVGAAVAAPAALTLLTQQFPAGLVRTRALTYYGLVSSLGTSAALTLGGLLTAWGSWRLGLLINVPAGAALVVLALIFMPDTPRQRGRFDLAGALTSTIGMTALVYGFTRAAEHAAWTEVTTLLAFGIGTTLMACFVMVELRVEHPITLLRLLADRDRAAALIIRVLIVGGMYGISFFLTQLLQYLHHFGPAQAGLGFLPMTLGVVATIQVIQRTQAKFGSTRLMLLGSAVMAVATIGLARVTADSHYLPGIGGPLLLYGLGFGLTFVPLTSLFLDGVRPHEAGPASGLWSTAQQLGGALSLAVLVTVSTSASQHANPDVLEETHPDEARHALTEAVAAGFTGTAVFTTLALVAVATFAVLKWRARTRPI